MFLPTNPRIKTTCPERLHSVAFWLGRSLFLCICSFQNLPVGSVKILPYRNRLLLFSVCLSRIVKILKPDSLPYLLC